jgi:hypothetical protein
MKETGLAFFFFFFFFFLWAVLRALKRALGHHILFSIYETEIERKSSTEKTTWNAVTWTGPETLLDFDIQKKEKVETEPAECPYPRAFCVCEYWTSASLWPKKKETL